MGTTEITIIQDTTEYEASIMPCRIKFTGTIKDDFNKDKNYWQITKEQDNKVETHFRGRKLNGKQIELQTKNYKGFIISKNSDDEDEQQQNDKYDTIGSFNKLNNFYNGNDENNYDELINEWLNISELLNKD